MEHDDFAAQRPVPERRVHPPRAAGYNADWAVVAVIAIGLGINLLARPFISGNNTAADNPVLAAPAPASTLLFSVMTSHPSMGAAPPGMGMNPSTMTTTPSAGNLPAPTATSSVLPPPMPSDGAKAG